MERFFLLNIDVDSVFIKFILFNSYVTNNEIRIHYVNSCVLIGTNLKILTQRDLLLDLNRTLFTRRLYRLKPKTLRHIKKKLF